ncbi:MAG TPA: trypsin-like peptidase domain-containing protein [Symbiobacteriaceae bacterium]|jgi:serine protease Do
MFMGVVLVLTMVAPAHADTIEQRLAGLEARIAALEKALTLSVLDVPKLAAKAVPAIVSIYNVTEDDEVDSEGTGWIISPDGVIVTNAHVADLTLQQKVKFADGSVKVADVIMWDEFADLAELRVSGTGYPTLPLARSQPKVGDPLVVIGNALGYSNSVTVGVVSGVNRPDPNHNYHYPSLQTDAAVNHGNSGGPMLNANGEVVAIAAWGEMDSAQNISFGVPIGLLSASLSRVVAGRGIVRSWLGVSAAEPYWSRGMLPNDLGLVITDAHPLGAAATAGVKAGNFLRAVNGVPVNYLGDLRTELDKHKPGDTVTLSISVYHGSRTKLETTQVTVVLGEYSDKVPILIPRRYDPQTDDLF